MYKDKDLLFRCTRIGGDHGSHMNLVILFDILIRTIINYIWTPKWKGKRNNKKEIKFHYNADKSSKMYYRIPFHNMFLDLKKYTKVSITFSYITLDYFDYYMNNRYINIEARKVKFWRSYFARNIDKFQLSFEELFANPFQTFPIWLSFIKLRFCIFCKSTLYI